MLPARRLQPAAEIARRRIVCKLRLEPVDIARADDRMAGLADTVDLAGQLQPGPLGRSR